MEKDEPDPLHKRVRIYPVYIDSSLDRAGGRKVSKADGLPEPNIQCVGNAAVALGFNAVLKMKSHPRNFWHRGCAFVEFYDDQHRPVHPLIRTRMELYRAVAAKVKEMGNVVRAPTPAPAATTKVHGTEKAKLKREQAKRAKR